MPVDTQSGPDDGKLRKRTWPLPPVRSEAIILAAFPLVSPVESVTAISDIGAPLEVLTVIVF